MADQGATFQIDLAVGGASTIDAAASSLDVLSKRLEDAGAASKAANAALDAGNASYQAAQTNANNTAKALERIGNAAEAQRGKLQAAMDTGDTSAIDKASSRLNALTSQQGLATQKAVAAKAALDAEAASLDKLQAGASAAEKAEQGIAKEQETAAKAAEKAASATGEAAEQGDGNSRKIASALGKLGGPLGSVGQKVFETKEAFSKLQEGFGDAAPEVIAAVGAAAVAAAVVAVTAAAIAGVIAIGNWAVGLADTARSNQLLAEGIAHSVTGGEALNAQINSLATKVPLTTQELSSMADGLAKTGLRGDALTAALNKSATAAAKLKFGPDFADQMDSLAEQSKRLQIGISSIFGGLKIDAMLKAFSTLTDLFSTDDAAGQGLKVMFETIFQPLIDGVTAFVPKLRAAFLQMEILALKAEIAIKPYSSKIKEIGEAFVVISAIVVGVVVVALAAAAAIVAILVDSVYQLGQTAVSVVEFFVNGFTQIENYLSSLSFSDILSGIGTDMINGLIGGITGAGPAVVSALGGVVSSAIDSAKKALGIASPSKVFAEIGMNTSAGMQQGIEGGSGGVQSAMEDMAAPSAPGPAASAPAAASASSSSSGGFNFQGAQFTFNGVKDADDAEARFGELLTKILEGDNSQLGAAVPST